MLGQATAGLEPWAGTLLGHQRSEGKASELILCHLCAEAGHGAAVKVKTSPDGQMWIQIPALRLPPCYNLGHVHVTSLSLSFLLHRLE